MKRAAIFFVCLLAALPSLAQQPDRSLALEAGFNDKVISEQAPEGANGIERALYTVRKQLTGRDNYNPPNYIFFRQAVKELGFFPAIFATADRILRDTRIGTVRERFDADHTHIQEGPEAYHPSGRI